MRNHTPKPAKLLLALCLPRGVTARVIDDLDEEFSELLPRLGRRNAAIWYWKQALMNVAQTIKRLFGHKLERWAQRLLD